MKNKLPWIITLLCGLWYLSTLRPPAAPESGFEVSKFGKIPVMAGGRIQPMESLAQNSLLQIREKRSIRLLKEKRKMSATEWLMEVMMNPEVANDRRAFRIDHPELKSLLQLPEKNPDPNSEEDGKHYTWNQIEPHIQEIEAQGKRIGQIEATRRNHFERALMKLQERMFIYMRLRNTLQPQDTIDFQKDINRFVALIEPGLLA